MEDDYIYANEILGMIMIKKYDQDASESFENLNLSGSLIPGVWYAPSKDLSMFSLAGFQTRIPEEEEIEACDGYGPVTIDIFGAGEMEKAKSMPVNNVDDIIKKIEKTDKKLKVKMGMKESISPYAIWVDLFDMLFAELGTEVLVKDTKVIIGEISEYEVSDENTKEYVFYLNPLTGDCVYSVDGTTTKSFWTEMGFPAQQFYAGTYDTIEEIFVPDDGDTMMAFVWEEKVDKTYILPVPSEAKNYKVYDPVTGKWDDLQYGELAIEEVEVLPTETERNKVYRIATNEAKE
jgi:ribosomal protein L20A (L18A)